MLAELVQDHGIRVAVLTGDIPKDKSQQIIEDVQSGNVQALFSTTQLIGEGFDCKCLSALFLTTPIRNTSKLQQVVDRVLRSDEGKKIPKVFDYPVAHMQTILRHQSPQTANNGTVSAKSGIVACATCSGKRFKTDNSGCCISRNRNDHW